MFRSNFWKFLSLIIIVEFMCLMMFTVSGCHEYEQRERPTVDGAIELFETLQTTNAVTSPLNPFAIPIGAGLAGIVAMLESLRRVEKGKRKYAEHELNNNNKNHT